MICFLFIIFLTHRPDAYNDVHSPSSAYSNARFPRIEEMSHFHYASVEFASYPLTVSFQCLVLFLYFVWVQCTVYSRYGVLSGDQWDQKSVLHFFWFSWHHCAILPLIIDLWLYLWYQIVFYRGFEKSDWSFWSIGIPDKAKMHRISESRG